MLREKLSNLQNFTIWEINKFSEFFQFQKLSKFQKMANFGIVYPFDIPRQSQFCQSSHLTLETFEIFRIGNFKNILNRKFYRTF